MRDMVTELIDQFEMMLGPIGAIECSREFFDSQLGSIDPEEVPIEHRPFGVSITVIDTLKGKEVHFLNLDQECYKMIRQAGDNWYALDTRFIGCYIHAFNLEEKPSE